MCSTMRLKFNLYSTFNTLFNIQLRIQHSTIHFIFNSLFSHSVIYSTISTIYSTFNFNSTFNYSFNSFEPSLLLVSDTDHCLLKTWRRRRLECQLRNRSLWRWHMKMIGGLAGESGNPRYSKQALSLSPIILLAII